MKKIFLLLVAAAATTFTSCNNDDDRVIVDNDTIGETFDVSNVNFVPDQNGNYGINVPLDPAIFDSDAILVYRQTGVDGGNPVWRIIPETVYLGGGAELEYTADFTVNDLVIAMNSNVDLAAFPFYTQNQRFRVVIVPSDFSSTVDVNNYDAVVNALDISENDIQMIEVNKIY